MLSIIVLKGLFAFGKLGVGIWDCLSGPLFVTLPTKLLVPSSDVVPSPQRDYHSMERLLPSLQWWLSGGITILSSRESRIERHYYG